MTRPAHEYSVAATANGSPPGKPAQRGLAALPRRIVRSLRARWKTWLRDQNWLAGKIVELRGNRVRVGSLTFDVSNRAISTGLKGRFLTGSWEAGTVGLLRDHVNPDLPVIEFGAGIGVVSCLTNTLLRDRSRHVVVEAQSALIPTIERNRMINGCGFTVRHGALAYGADTVDFWLLPRRFIGNSLFPKKGGVRERVPAIQIESIVNDMGVDRAMFLIDVEGTEVDMVAHELQLLSRICDTLIVEEHESPEAAARLEDMHRALAGAGFTMVARHGWDVVYRNKRFHPLPARAPASDADSKPATP